MKTKQRDLLAALGFLAPNFLGFFLFVLFPVVFSILLLMTNWSLNPGIDRRFVGLDNVWQLVGFRPIEGAQSSGGLIWIVAFLGCYAALIGGIILSFTSLGDKKPGIRLGGWLGVLGAVVLLVLSVWPCLWNFCEWVCTCPLLGLSEQSLEGVANAFSGPMFQWSLGMGAGLIAITLLCGYFFFLGNDDADFVGPGAYGPILVVGSIALIYILRGPVFERWEPIDANFYFFLYNTLFMMVAIPVSIVGSLILALVLSEPLLKVKARHKILLTSVLVGIGLLGFGLFWRAGLFDQGILWGVFWGIAALGIAGGVFAFRTLFYIPTFTAGIAVMLLWKQMFNPNFGLLNEGLRIIYEALGIGAEPPRWLGDPSWAKPAIMLMGFWTVVGGQNMLLYLAGLSNISPELYEAASIDGASKRQAFWNVTWPQLAPTTFFIVIMSTIMGLQGGFEQARVLTNGGPAGSTKTLAFYVYEKAFMELELGYASGIAWVLFLMVFLLTALNWRFGNRYVNY